MQDKNHIKADNTTIENVAELQYFGKKRKEAKCILQKLRAY
jgi:hypothetical protein